MEHHSLYASREALMAISLMVNETLHSPHIRPNIGKVTRYDLCYELKHLQHAQLCHYVRCDATREALMLIGEAVDRLLSLLDDDDDTAEGALRIAEPYRHHLYTSVFITALALAEEDEVEKERAYWKEQNAMRIGPAYREASRA